MSAIKASKALVACIYSDVAVELYDRCRYVARIYTDRIIVTTPYVKWVGNTGVYAEKKEAIRDRETIAAVLADLSDDAEKSAWRRIAVSLHDHWLARN